MYKQLTNPHEKAVFTGGMHAAASTRWGGPLPPPEFSPFEK